MHSHCHDSVYEGHYGVTKTAARVLECGFFWPTLFKDAREFVLHYDRCQHTCNIFTKCVMPLSSIQEVEIFYVWGVNFMGAYSSTYRN